jgi:hypothetical protein
MEQKEFAAKNLLNVEMEKNIKKYNRDACRKHKVEKTHEFHMDGV